MSKIKLFDTVATLYPVSIERLILVDSDYSAFHNLQNGQVGTVVEVDDKTDNYQYLVEFADLTGWKYAMATLKADELTIA